MLQGLGNEFSTGLTSKATAWYSSAGVKLCLEGIDLQRGLVEQYTHTRGCSLYKNHRNGEQLVMSFKVEISPLNRSFGSIQKGPHLGQGSLNPDFLQA